MHGTVEWLPGSPLGNTHETWPDMLLGGYVDDEPKRAEDSFCLVFSVSRLGVFSVCLALHLAFETLVVFCKLEKCSLVDDFVCFPRAHL